MGLGALLALALAAQPGPPPVRGVLLELDSDGRTGSLSLRAPDFRVHVFRFDPRTRFEGEQRSLDPSALRRGDLLEVTCEQDCGLPLPPAATLRVLSPASGSRDPARLPPWPRPALGEWFPRGSLMLAGVVTRRETDRLDLRIRNRGECMVLLREDTRWLADGLPVDAAALPLHTHVFIRAGRTPEGEIEAFQVVWGRILRVR